MRIAFVRHGTRKRDGEDCEQPLSQDGEKQVSQLKQVLANVNLVPNRCFSSRCRHATQTATLLLERSGTTQPVACNQLGCLTPKSQPFGIDAFLEEAEAHSLDPADVILVVGHEPRLGQLLSSITSTRVAPIARAGVICVEAPSLVEVRQGLGRIAWRWPVDGTGSIDLGPKLASKMSVSGMLAGLTFAAAAVLLEGGTSSVWETTAIMLLTLAVALFVASLYAYDRLLMPRAFWEQAEPGRWPKILGWKSYREERNANGILYAEMIWTWQYLFSPALLFAALGYLAIFVDLKGELPNQICVRVPLWACDRAPLVLGLGIILLAVAYYRLARPRIAVD